MCKESFFTVSTRLAHDQAHGEYFSTGFSGLVLYSLDEIVHCRSAHSFDRLGDRRQCGTHPFLKGFVIETDYGYIAGHINPTLAQFADQAQRE
jgi:hypothetical protein